MGSLRNIIKHSFKSYKNSDSGIYNIKLFSTRNISEHQNSNTIALKNAIKQCRKEIRKSRRWKVLPSPKCFEHAAMLSRQAQNYENEIKICRLYLSYVDQYLSKRSFNKKSIELKAQSLCKPLADRLLIATNLSENNGISVDYL